MENVCFICLDHNLVEKCSTQNCLIYYHSNCVKLTDVKCPYCKKYLYQEIYCIIILRRFYKLLIPYLFIVILLGILFIMYFYQEISVLYLIFYALILFCSQIVIFLYYFCNDLASRYNLCFKIIFMFNIILQCINFYIIYH